MKARLSALPASDERPRDYDRFIREMRAKARLCGLSWPLHLDANGEAPPEAAWDIRKLNGSIERYAARLDNFRTDDVLRAAALNAGRSPARVVRDVLLPRAVRDFICAFTVWRAGQIKRARGVREDVRILRGLFTIIDAMPWAISSADLSFCQELVSPAESRTLRTLAALVNQRLLSLAVPLELPGAKVDDEKRALATLGERRNGHQLPEVKALHELVRIVWREQPRSHTDLLRFVSVRLLMLTGLRPLEVLLMRRDCRVSEEHIDSLSSKGKGAHELPPRTLWLRYFKEKDRDAEPGLLVERRMPVPDIFVELVDQAIDLALSATEKLARFARGRRGRRSPVSEEATYPVLGGEVLRVSDFLMLQLFGESGALPASFKADSLVHILGYTTFITGMSPPHANDPTLFSRYGCSEEAKNFHVRPKSLRHLMLRPSNSWGRRRLMTQGLFGPS